MFSVTFVLTVKVWHLHLIFGERPSAVHRWYYPCIYMLNARVVPCFEAIQLQCCVFS